MILSVFLVFEKKGVFCLVKWAKTNAFGDRQDEANKNTESFQPFSFQKKKNAQNQRAKLIFSKWAKIPLFNFGLFQQVFENLKLNKLAKEERRLDLEDRIWRLEFGKTQFSCFEAAIWRMNFKACTFERLALIFGFGRGAQVVKTSPFWKWIYTAQASTLGVFIFYLVRFRPWDPTKTLDIGRRRSICFNNAQSE